MQKTQTALIRTKIAAIAVSLLVAWYSFVFVARFGGVPITIRSIVTLVGMTGVTIAVLINKLPGVMKAKGGNMKKI